MKKFLNRFITIWFAITILVVGLVLIPPSVYSAGKFNVKVYLEGYDGVSEVKLGVYDSSFNNLFNVTFTGDSYNLSLERRGEYVFVLTYKDVPYMENVEVRRNNTEVYFVVYEPIKDDSMVDIAAHHVIVEPKGGYIEVIGIIFFRNIGDKVIVNGTQMKVYLPRDFIKLKTSIMSCCVEVKEWGFIFDLMGYIYPNDTFRVNYAYEIPVSSDKYVFSFPVAYDTEFLLIAVKEGYEVVNPVNLEYSRDIDLDNGRFKVFEVSDLVRDTEVSLEIRGVGSSGITTMTMLIIVTSAFVVFLSVYNVFARKPKLEDLEREKEELLREMKDLEERFKRGELEEEEYLMKRIKIKKKVLKVIKKIERMKGRDKSESHPSSGGD